MREQPHWRRYLRFWGPDIAADLNDELRFHLGMRERDFLAAGLPPTAAREEALARFGDPDKVARWLRDHDTRKLRQYSGEVPDTCFARKRQLGAVPCCSQKSLTYSASRL
jgi:hypothetical protein